MVKPRRAARSRGFRRLLTASPLYWVSAAVVLALLVVVAGPWARPLFSIFPADDGATQGVAAAPTLDSTMPTLVATTPIVQATTFSTRPPGDALPTDDQCADRVTPARETIPGNATYNKRVGSQQLSNDFFDPESHDERANQIAARVTGAYSGSTREILQWTACKWGIDEEIVRAQAETESSLRQSMQGDWTTNGEYCAPGHGLGADGRDGECPESWGILQVRYRTFQSAFPDALRSTAFNADTTYAVWRACYEGYESWLSDYEAGGHTYKAGDAWGCIGRWYSGRWYDDTAKRYIDCIQRITEGRRACPDA